MSESLSNKNGVGCIASRNTDPVSFCLRDGVTQTADNNALSLAAVCMCSGSIFNERNVVRARAAAANRCTGRRQKKRRFVGVRFVYFVISARHTRASPLNSAANDSRHKQPSIFRRRKFMISLLIRRLEIQPRERTRRAFQNYIEGAPRATWGT